MKGARQRLEESGSAVRRGSEVRKGGKIVWGWRVEGGEV